MICNYSPIDRFTARVARDVGLLLEVDAHGDYKFKNKYGQIIFNTRKFPDDCKIYKYVNILKYDRKYSRFADLFFGTPDWGKDFLAWASAHSDVKY